MTHDYTWSRASTVTEVGLLPHSRRPRFHPLPFFSTNHPFPLSSPLYLRPSPPSSCPPSSLFVTTIARKGPATMFLGKRPRPPVRRTTSMANFTFDIVPMDPPPRATLFHGATMPEGNYDPSLFSSLTPPRNPTRRNSADFLETPHFLRACGSCRRRLAPGKDIYMYRGDAAFCSLECRQQQMTQDERSEKCSLRSVKEGSATVSGSESSTKGETMAAA